MILVQDTTRHEPRAAGCRRKMVVDFHEGEEMMLNVEFEIKSQSNQPILDILLDDGECIRVVFLKPGRKGKVNETQDVITRSNTRNYK